MGNEKPGIFGRNEKNGGSQLSIRPWATYNYHCFIGFSIALIYSRKRSSFLSCVEMESAYMV